MEWLYVKGQDEIRRLMDGWRVDTRLLDGQRVLETLCLDWLDTWLADGLPQGGVLMGGCGGLCWL